jgi:hypothetical protein
LADDAGGFRFTARTGVILPSGRLGTPPQVAHDGLSESYLFPSGVPLAVEVGAAFPGIWYWGAFLQTVAFLGCGNSAAGTPGVRCTNEDVQAGTAMEWRSPVGHGISPWLGLSLAYEKASSADGSGSFAVELTGFDLGVEGGVDLRVDDHVTLGPFASATFGSYATASSSDPEWSGFSSSVHGWLSVGIRATVGTLAKR